MSTKLNITYFKPSGKFYSNGVFESNQTEYYYLVEEFKEFLLKGDTSLPGLISKEWDGPILLDNDEIGFPVLLNLNQ